jgi:hypothetical protein
MGTWIKRSLLVLLVLLIIQLVQPSRSNPPVDSARTIHASLSVDPAVASVFARSCNDCHSNTTVWPWYSKVAPASWLVASDVNRGRKALNFSDWKSLNPEKQKEIVPEICKEVADRDMPTEEYLLMHPRAKLTGAEVQAICGWAHSVRPGGLERAEKD